MGLKVRFRPIADAHITWIDGGMTDAILTLEQMETGIEFFHQADERAFFEWLERIPCVAEIKGEGARGLVVRLKRRPSQDDLKQFLALAHRYGLDMRKFAKFETDGNKAWFRDRLSYWHDGVFGAEALSTE